MDRTGSRMRTGDLLLFIEAEDLEILHVIIFIVLAGDSYSTNRRMYCRFFTALFFYKVLFVMRET